jgi:ATP-dependent DNA helicase RecG
MSDTILTIAQLEMLITLNENEQCEFKEAKDQFDSTKLTKYCAALANEKGGKLILGVTDKPPRDIVGTSAFPSISKIRSQLLDRLHLRIEVIEIQHHNGRVLVFIIPPRPTGRPIEYKGAYWMRSGESLVPMTPDKLQIIFAEAEPDFSSQVCTKATFNDLDLNAIEVFRKMWIRHSGNENLNILTPLQLLEDAEVIVDSGITYAALIMFGTRKALGKYLAQSEIVFEYRSTESSTAFQQRKEHREGFFLIFDDLWDTINLRNDLHHFQDGLFMWKIPTFNESVIREAVLNSVCHRDYRLEGSVFVRQYPRKIEFVSPGGFPPGISPENILWKQSPRNRRVAEAFSKCGLVERSGQGANRMFEQCVKESKSPPEFGGTDDYQVQLTLHGEVQDPLFLKFLELLGQKTQESFVTADFITLDLIYRAKKLPDWSKSRLQKLRKAGVIELVGRKNILSRHYYEFIDKKGVYTRKKGLDRDTNKQLLLKHIQDNKKHGSRLQELKDVLPSLSHDQVQTLLKELKRDDIIFSTGKTRAALWYPKKE